MKTSYVYILSSGKNGTLYIGVTSDLIKRIWQHKNHLADGFTDKYNVVKLVYYEIFDDIYTARQREKTMKHWVRQWKINQIEKENPSWRDLYEDISGSSE
jgi:putative endonuclease